jgi:hypothetical protein
MLLLAPPFLVGQAQPGLENGFAHPPASARPLTWWHWINGNVSREGILADMQAMKRAGLAGVQMVNVSMYIPQGSARYGSDEWYADVRYAIQTAHHLGLSFGVANGPGWSGGLSGDTIHKPRPKARNEWRFTGRTPIFRGEPLVNECGFRW